MEFKDRNIYLEDIPLAEAWQTLTAALSEADKWQKSDGALVPLQQAHGRVTAEPIWAKLSSPHFHASAMDGYAVQANSTLNATETKPLELELNTEAIPINTGDPIPPQMNAVIMIEHVQQHSNHISIVAPVAPWQHVRMMGEDIVASELVVPMNHRLRPVDIGAIAGCGYHQVNVRHQPHVVIIPTGSELVSADTQPERGQLIEYNSLVLGAQVEEVGGKVTTLPIIPDNQAKLEAAVQEALELTPDLLLILSGSSAGAKDFTASLIHDLGQLLVHGIAVRPGHPVIIGMIDRLPVLGIPGYPVSAALTGELFVQRLLAHWLGVSEPFKERPRIKARSTRKILSPTGDDDFVRMTVAKVGDRILATPLSRGAGIITSLVKADGLAHIPRFSEGVDMGEELDIILYHDDIENVIQIMGSHDPMLDLLGQHLAVRHSGYRLTSANVGSMGGIVALKRDETHLAGMHLLDPETGEYNLAYLDKQLPNLPLSIMTFAHREQGLMVRRGNPAEIRSLADLTRVRYVNRQRGAGTRLLLDYELQQLGLDVDQIEGYQLEEYTHLGVAAAVATGIADCGLGVRSAAQALDLDFISIGWERFDLVIPQKHVEDVRIQYLLDTLQSESFKQDLAKQPGYDIRATGQIIR